jgi:hypothetical protein
MQKAHPLQTILLLVVAGVFLFLWKEWTWALYVGLIIGLGSLLSPLIAEKVDWFWRQLSKILSWFVPKILLSIIFFLLLWPIALLSRLFGNSDPLDLKDRKNSMFRIVEKSYQPKDFERPW